MRILNFASSALLTLSGVKIAMCPMMEYDISFAAAAIALGVISMASAVRSIAKVDITE